MTKAIIILTYYSNPIPSPLSEIVEKVKSVYTTVPYRPNVMEVEDCPECMLTTMQECWAEHPDTRPDIKSIATKLKPLHKGM